MTKTLTEQQKLFLEVLFDQVSGDLVAAKRLAGYSEGYPTSQLVKVLQDEIVEATKAFLARSGPKAAVKLVGILDNPGELGVKEILAASKDILDRVGVAKTEKIDIGANGIFFMPSKRQDGED